MTKPTKYKLEDLVAETDDKHPPVEEWDWGPDVGRERDGWGDPETRSGLQIYVLSDLHRECNWRSQWEPPEVGCDVVVLAGDIGSHERGLLWAIQTFHWGRQDGLRPAIVYVPGNHEGYDHDWIDTRQELQRVAQKARAEGVRVWVLDNQAVEIEGVRFVGSTLWSDYALLGTVEASMEAARKGLYDHQSILLGKMFFTPQDALELHQEARAWLEAELSKPFAGKTVVVTHHLPSMRSVPPQFATDKLTPAFASDLDCLVRQVDLWVHGHSHVAVDYQLGRCRVVSNVRGYPGEQEAGSGFLPDLVLDLGEPAPESFAWWNATRERVQRIIEGPDQDIDRIIRAVLDNGGTVPAALIQEFPALTPPVAAWVELAISKDGSGMDDVVSG